VYSCRSVLGIQFRHNRTVARKVEVVCACARTNRMFAGIVVRSHAGGNRTAEFGDGTRRCRNLPRMVGGIQVGVRVRKMQSFSTAELPRVAAAREAACLRVWRVCVPWVWGCVCGHVPRVVCVGKVSKGVCVQPQCGVCAVVAVCGAAGCAVTGNPEPVVWQWLCVAVWVVLPWGVVGRPPCRSA